ncbi:hypothetical protein F53441_6481 [Fusarium austroafricanum]|uniref:Heterokaryon incompatibility domain-containing protein n=1 Tax=Fusarium austroafricanum TaxID=2364996 RepID=A0A8H4KH81_9HYPO|nr:hypothetical protein F53441_6481 [Fusarium austroafricanum]
MKAPLCEVCARFNIEDLVSDQGFGLHESLLDLHKCGETCQLCSNAARYIAWGNSTLKFEETNGEYLTTQQARVFYGQHIHRNHGVTIVVTDVGSEAPSKGDMKFPWFLMRTIAGDPAQRFGAKTARMLPRNTSSPDSTIQALKWLKECLLSTDCFEDCSHVTDNKLEQKLTNAPGLDDKFQTLSLSENLGKPVEQSEIQRLQLCSDIKFLHSERMLSQDDKSVNQERAARLVEIKETGSGIKLKIVQGSADCAPYVALSYRWGGLEAVWQTTTKNLDSRLADFSISELPKTLAETIQVTRNLGLKWIWIDSLCIVQDDKDDWAREAVKMAVIYQNALVTIAADSSQDAKAGLHNEKSNSIFNENEVIKISSKLSTDEESSLFLFSDEDGTLNRPITNLRDMGDLLNHCTLRDRGWTMQERILSPRLIHYASDQLYWECYHGIQESEDELHWMGRSVSIAKIVHRMNAPEDDEAKKKELRYKELRHMLYYWYVLLIGGDYSHRSLTYHDDKLLAIGGVARALEDIHPMGYAVGHWCEDDDELVRSLCWKRGGPGIKSAKYRAPSWSWASQDSAIDYGHFTFVGTGGEVVVSEPLAMESASPDHTAFGRCTDAYLQIKAKVAHGSVFPNCGHDFTDYHQLGLGGGYTVDPLKERCAFLMLEGGETSDVVWLDESQATQTPITDPIDVKVVMLSEIRSDDEEPRPGACLICTLDKKYHLTRIGFTESLQYWKEGQGGTAPPISGPRLCDKEAIELILI